ncbi:hypothetical protein I3843_07G050000, partial [Carya illinoinensis]
FISQELLKAIRESMYAIHIFSKNYASSRWCLTELAQIVEFMKESSLTSLSVFYHVDPSELFLDMKKTLILIWRICKHGDRVALKEVGNISGWHFHLRYESTIVQEIIKRILQGLSRNFSSLSRDLVGIESGVEEMMNILAIGLDDVRFVGIHGMRGVGKKTLAEVIYHRISYQFEASSFIVCIREETRNCDREGMHMIRNRLCNKKVLLVLDDVDREQHLTALAGSHDWFGLGSRIILTSKGNHLLKRHATNDIYKIKELNNDEALQLFSLAAFKKPLPEENYVDLSKGFLKYAQGLPLKCLITIASKRLRMHDLLQKMGHEIIYNESPEEPSRRSRLWHCKDVLHMLKNNTGTEVIEGIVLNLPYEKDQERFSVKAFSKMKELRILKICNTSIRPFKIHANTWVTGLEWSEYPSKSLSNSFQADNLIELRFPRSHIRQLWKGISVSLGSLKRFDLSGSQNLLETPDLIRVPNLETLDLEGCTSLSKAHKSIGVLKWLRQLNLYACKCLKSFPNEISLESLEHFYLYDCSRFEKFPNIVGNMTSLKLFYLNGTTIKALPLSFKSLGGLSILSLHNCKKLSIFPSVICSLSSLKILDVSDCLALDGIQDMNGEGYLEQLYTGGTAIKFTKFFALENSDPRLFVDSHLDLQFVEFVYYFETNEGPLKKPLVLHAPGDPSIGPFMFGVYVPAKWFFEQSNNLDG